MSDKVDLHLGPQQAHPQINLPKNLRRFSNLNMLTAGHNKVLNLPGQIPAGLLTNAGILEIATRKPQQVKGSSIAEQPFKSQKDQKRIDEMSKDQLMEHFKSQKTKTEPAEKISKVSMMAQRFQQSSKPTPSTQKPVSTLPKPAQTFQPVKLPEPGKLPEPNKLPAPGKLQIGINKFQLPPPGSQPPQRLSEQPKPAEYTKQVTQPNPVEPSTEQSNTDKDKQPPQRQLTAIEQRIKNLQEAQDKLKQTQQKQPLQFPSKPAPQPGQPTAAQKFAFKVTPPEEQKSDEPSKPKPATVNRVRVATVSTEFLSNLNNKIGTGSGPIPGMMGFGGMTRTVPIKRETNEDSTNEPVIDTTSGNRSDIGNKLNIMMTQSLGNRMQLPIPKPVHLQEETQQETDQVYIILNILLQKQQQLLGRASVKGRARTNTAQVEF